VLGLGKAKKITAPFGVAYFLHPALVSGGLLEVCGCDTPLFNATMLK